MVFCWQSRFDEMLRELTEAFRCEPDARTCTQQLMEFAVHQCRSVDVLTRAFAPALKGMLNVYI